MHVPSAFRPSDPEQARDVVRAHSFGLLLSRGVDGRPLATHTPMLLEREDVVLGHLARANPQWRGLGGQDVLCVFSGPHAYISPAWYATRPNVPTWDYVAAHVAGRIELFHEPDALHDTVERLCETFETSGWRLGDQPKGYRMGLVKGIVGFRVRIERLDAALKLNQNHSAESRAGAVAGLRARGHPDDAAVADLIERFAPVD